MVMRPSMNWKILCNYDLYLFIYFSMLQLFICTILLLGVFLLRFLDLTPDLQSRMLCIKSITSAFYLKFYRKRHVLFKKHDLRYCMSCQRILFLIRIFFLTRNQYVTSVEESDTIVKIKIQIRTNMLYFYIA